MNNNKPNVKLKTIQFKIDKKHNKILDEMTIISKNIFNCCVYAYNVFYQYKNNVYEDMYNFFIEINKSELQEHHKKFLIKLNNMDLITSYYKKYYDIYSNNQQLIKNNNNIIYEHIKNKIGNVILNSQNIKLYYDEIIDELNRLITYDYKNKNIVFINIVDKIFKSFYDKKYFLTRYQLLNHIKFTFNDAQLIDDIKKKNYYYDKEVKVNYKKKVETEFKVSLKSDQYIFKVFVYENCLGNNKTKIPADVVLNIIDKYSEAIKGYYGKINKKMSANKPNYLDKNDRFNLFYFPSSFKIIDNKARLTIGKYISDNYNNYCKKELYKINDRKYCYNNHIVKNVKKQNKKNYLKINNGYVHKDKIVDANYLNLKVPKVLKNSTIKLIQVKPYGNNFYANITYEESMVEFKENKIKPNSENSISIDTGINNLMTIYNPTGYQYIIKGGKIKSINEFYNQKISNLQSINKKHLDINKFNRLYSLLKERSNKLNGEINKIVDKLVEVYNDKEYFIIGYNEGWKNKVNLGRNVNRMFYNIPYARILFKLKEKLIANGKQLIINEESFTSKCDGLALEALSKQDNYLGSRVHRGLYVSSTGNAINADLNGAINIMRKVINLTEIKGEKIFNPQILVA